MSDPSSLPLLPTFVLDPVAIARSTVANYHREYGVLCTLLRGTYDARSELTGPPYNPVPGGSGLPVSVNSSSSFEDPDVDTVLKQAEISIQEYRRLTMPFGLVEVRKDDMFVKEPVNPNSDKYLVIEVIAPDETSPLSLFMHCQKM